MGNWTRQDEDAFILMVGGVCFFCGHGFSQDEGIVNWNGLAGDGILLHTVCAEKLGSQLIRDAGRCDGRLGVHPSMWEKPNMD